MRSLDPTDGPVPDRVVANGLAGGGLPVERDGAARCELGVWPPACLELARILRGSRPAADRVGPELARRPGRPGGGLVASQARIGLRILWLLWHADLPDGSRATVAPGKQRASHVPRRDA